MGTLESSAAAEAAYLDGVLDSIQELALAYVWDEGCPDEHERQCAKTVLAFCNWKSFAQEYAAAL